MRHRHDINDEVVQGIYLAAAGLVSWSEPLGKLFGLLNLRSMQLIFVDRRSGILLGSEQPAALFDQAAVKATIDHIREWARIDPHVEAAAQLPVGGVYDSEKSGARVKYADTPFYREYFLAHQNRGVLACKVTETNEHAALIGLVRSQWHPAFNDGDAAILTRYCGHLRTALQVGRYVERLEANAIAGRALLDATDHPMFLLDGDLCIKAVNPHAQELLDQGNVLYECSRALCFRAERNGRAIRVALADLLAHVATKDRAGARLAVPGGKPLLCALWYLRPETTMAAFGRQPVVLLSIAAHARGTAIDSSFLEALFELTPAESRVAVALTSEANLSTIARERRVSIDTIKSQVRSIYEKVGVNNRAQLVHQVAQLGRP